MIDIGIHCAIVSSRAAAGLLLFVLTSTLICAGELPASSMGNVVVPQPAKPAHAQTCVEDTDIMRRNHMEFLLHQRDTTVIQGIRSSKYSLTGCIDCHAQPSLDGKIVRIDSPDHFCAGCHQYASVKIDCFECHADRPLASFSQSSYEPRGISAPAEVNFGVMTEKYAVGVHNRLMQQVTMRGD